MLGGSSDAQGGNLAGGFRKVDLASNDEGIEGVRKALTDEITKKVGKPVKVEILDAQAQVVAGTNYKVKLRAEDSHLGKTYYEAQVWAKLPHMGGNFEVTKLNEITAEAAGETKEEGDDPGVDAAAAYAVQQLSEQSNSLFPFQLKEVISARKTSGSNGNKEGVTHHLHLRVSQGNMPYQEFEVEVAETSHGHALLLSKIMMNN